jgi:glutathione reductase (NADPH)
MSGAAEEFDYVVIGGGSGGISSARRAAAHGAKKIAVIEKQRLGGTCVNVGCVPKKVMFNTATVMETIHGAKNFGYSIDESAVSFDWASIKASRDAYVTRLNGIYERNLGNSGIEYIAGEAAFIGPSQVSVGDRVLTAPNILIAVGGTPTPPKCEGGEHCIDSDGFFELEEQPRSVAIIGGGYIAVEMAGIFAALGTEVHQYVRGPEGVMRRLEPYIRENLVSEMERGGINIHTDGPPSLVEKLDDGRRRITSAEGASQEVDVVLCAIGRDPLTGSLGLDKAGVELAPSGHIKVDEWSETRATGVIAVGDVISGGVDLTPVAMAAGRLLADRLFGGFSTARASYEFVPTVIFSHPPVATCGYSEPEAVEKFGEDAVKTYTSRFANMWYGTWALDYADKPKTAMKIVCVGEEERVVGIHIIGIGADEMMQGFGVAMKMGATKGDLDRCVAIHPTASEELVTAGTWGASPGGPRTSHQPAGGHA